MFTLHMLKQDAIKIKDKYLLCSITVISNFRIAPNEGAKKSMIFELCPRIEIGAMVVQNKLGRTP